MNKDGDKDVEGVGVPDDELALEEQHSGKCKCQLWISFLPPGNINSVMK